jgi:flavin reductase (DIM6/NTAB) family NADH-FMN oxidoreductase RutF
MFYRANKAHGLPFDPFKAIVTPRPIGWIGTLNAEGLPNLAPYSFFSAVSSSPNMIGFSSEGLKHSALNARDRGEFTFSLVTHDLAEAMNATSAPLAEGADEFAAAGIERGESVVIASPFVKSSPAALECKTLAFMELKDLDGRPVNHFFVLGQVVCVHIRDEFIVDGRFNTAKARPISRLGYRDYATVEAVWQMTRPSERNRAPRK